MRGSSAAVIAVAIAVAIAGARPAGAQTAGDKKRAAELTRAGQALLDAGDALAAVDKFQQAYAVIPHPTLLFNLGQAYRQADKPREALDHYRRFIAEGTNAELLALAKRHVTELEATLAKAEAETKPAEPPPPRPVEPEPALAPTTTPPAPVEPEPSGRRMTPLTWALGGVGIASIGVGTVLGLSAMSDYGDCEDRGACATDGEVDSIHNRLIASDLLIGVGVVSLAGGAVLYFLSDRNPEQPAVSIAPAEGGAMVVVGGSFR